MVGFAVAKEKVKRVEILTKKIVATAPMMKMIVTTKMVVTLTR